MTKQGDKVMRIKITTATMVRMALILLLFVAAYYLWNVLVIILVSLLLSTLIGPMADYLKKYRVPRAISVLGIYALLIGIIVGVFYLVVPAMVEQVQELSVQYQPEIEELTREQPLIGDIISGEILNKDLESVLQQIQQSHVTETLPETAGFLAATFGGFFSVFTVIVLTFYMVVERDALREGIRSYPMAKPHERFLKEVLPKVQWEIGAWLRGQLIIMFAVGILVFITLTILQVPFALILAILAGLFEVVPYLGPTLSAVPAVFVALSVSPALAVLVVVAYIVIQQIENNILSPKVMQKAVGVNPIISIIAILIGIELQGIPGAMLAIPTTVVIGVFLREWFRWRDRMKTAV